MTFGPDQPQRFLTAWFGPPSRDAPEPAASDVPAALASWHRQVGRWDPPVIRHNQVPAGREMDGDMLLVGIENQAVWLWGVPDSGGNPLVWERENQPGADWTPTGARLDEFLCLFMLTDALLGARFGLVALDVSAAALARFTPGWTALPATQWPGSHQTLWTMDGLLGWTIRNGRMDAPATDASTYTIQVAARTDHDLAVLDDTGIAWDWVSRIDL